MTNQQSSEIAEDAEREIMMTRVLDAPREMVYAMFTTAEHIGHWWGPRGFRTTTYSMDVRPGGVWRFMMHGPDGTDYGNRIVYQEVVPNERLVYDHGADDDQPRHFHVVIVFTAIGERTHLKMRMIFESREARDKTADFGAIEGGNQTLDRLQDYLITHGGRGKMTSGNKLTVEGRGEREIVATRKFNAPRALVFKALTTPDMIRQWLGCFGGWSCDVCEVDLRVGGKFRNVMNGPNGEVMGWGGTFTEIDPPARLVHTELFDEDWTGGEVIVATDLTEGDGVTTMSVVMTYKTTASRDAVLQSPMEGGMAASYDKMAALIEGSDG